ncbi:MAG: substrate-binding domain-containing protein [Firmicutes bacterium]|nr:substrate-binding domain-containing protein [Bacillota bacterium]
MSKYEPYLAELKSTTLFQNIPEDELLALLDAMDPEIVVKTPRDLGNPGPDIKNGVFAMCLRGTPLDELQPRPDVYNMPKPHEPGMLMGEIPALSEMTKSRAPKPKKFKFRGRGFPQLDTDEYMLRMTPEMVTKFYGEEHTHAQSIMLRNFLGILAQKVTDTRREKDAMEDRYLTELAPHRLHILHAGVAMGAVREAVRRWNELHPELPAAAVPGGSVNLIRDCLDGDPCDVLISADDAILRSMLPPESCEQMRIWAGNRMVITGSGITADNWQERMLAPETVFSHHDPYGDPGGYRAVMAMLLVDEVSPGLAKKLMEHPGHQGMEHEKPFFLRSGKRPDYEFAYYTSAKASGRDFAELPAVMNLGDPALADTYAKAGFAIDEEHTVYGAPIRHALTIPRTALHPEEAARFVELFMEMDFGQWGFERV